MPIAALPARWGRKGETLMSGPHGAAREREGKRAPTGGPYRAVRGGRGRARGLSSRSEPRHWAACASRAGAGSWAANGSRPGVSAGCDGPGFGAGPKSVKGIKIKEKLFYIFQSCKFV